MSCTFPLLVRIKTPNSAPRIQKVPCGRCRGCRLDKARFWALRCVHESQMHEENCFLTLTYNDQNLPSDGSLSKQHMQLFMKRLRKKIAPTEIKFYGCGEYGKQLKRPHYHVLIFGYDFPDKEFHHVSNPKERKRPSAGQNKVYTSKLLSQLWDRGWSLIGSISMQSAGYVARYIGKKIGGEKAIEHYKGLEPEFALMSRRPGIGSTWIEKYIRDVYPKDFTTHNGRKYKAPRFYDSRLMRKDWDMYEIIKKRREENIRDDDLLRRLQKDKYLKEVTKTLERTYES